MKFVFNNQIVLSQEPEGPIKEYIDVFAEHVTKQGYALSSISAQVRLVAFFSRWLKDRGIELHNIKPEHVGQYLLYRLQRVKPRDGDACTLNHLIDFLCNNNLIPLPKVSAPQLTAVETCLKEYEQYLRKDRCLAEATIINYAPFIQCFLQDCFNNKAVTLSRLSSRDVVQFVQRQALRLHRKRAKIMTTALRSFLSYALYLGDVVLDLAAAVPIVPNWSMPSIPRAISTKQVQQLLISIDRSTAIGRRDFAILLLLARLGLRASEVAFLELNDINWEAGTVRVKSKGGIHNEFPLSQEVGKSIAAYLRDGRPLSASRRVFLRAKAPIDGFRGVSSVSCIVRHALIRADINTPTYGAHQFRHGLATEMLRQGASLGEIGDVLGHRHPQTTKIYTKVDIEALRTLASPWLGVPQ
jgi:integrase/recombinase XerD